MKQQDQLIVSGDTRQAGEACGECPYRQGDLFRIAMGGNYAVLDPNVGH